MWSNPAFLFLQESLAHKKLLLITKTSPRGLDDSQLASSPFRVEVVIDVFVRPLVMPSPPFATITGGPHYVLS
jgi:hypothetical protein